MSKQPLQETALAGDGSVPRLDCPHCSYETTDQAAYEDHLTRHSQVNPNPTPNPGHSMTIAELTALLVCRFQDFMEHSTWPDNDDELERMALHIAGNLLVGHEVIPKKIGAHVSKTQPRRREP